MYRDNKDSFRTTRFSVYNSPTFRVDVLYVLRASKKRGFFVLFTTAELITLSLHKSRIHISSRRYVVVGARKTKLVHLFWGKECKMRGHAHAPMLCDITLARSG